MIKAPNLLFNILTQVDSTNNYAMAKIHEGLAIHGNAWFTSNQSSGKGQRGKRWESKKGENIALSIVFEPPHLLKNAPFLFNALISLACRSFLEKLIEKNVYIKWPNDLYVYDRKAVGILIENNFRGSSWNWTIVGIGINVNQVEFNPALKNAISIKQITGQPTDLILLAQDLHQQILQVVNNLQENSLNDILKQYNEHLYKLGEKVKLKKENMVFETTIIGVDHKGFLITNNSIEQQFQVGDVEWVWDKE